MKKRDYKWFVEPLDSHTNGVISNEVPEENFSHGVICEDGKPHNLWECSFQVVSALMRSQRNLNLQFKIFNREGKGKIRECTFLYSGIY